MRSSLSVIVCATVLATGAAAAQSSLRSRVAAYLEAPASGPFQGAVLLETPGAAPLTLAYGVADADLGVPLTASMRFGIGSVTKPITATAVMRLIERGTLRKADPVCRYVIPCPAAWVKVTVEHLLSHTSGIPDLFNELPAAPVDETKGVIDAAIAKHLDSQLSFSPGERYAYNNFGYFLLGYILEQATGKSWEQVLHEQVFAPAGMLQTQYDDVWGILPGRARGYEKGANGLRHIRYHDHAAYAAGGLLSTLADLRAFDDALVSGKLVTAATLQDMTTARLADYGLGWQVIRAHGRPQRNHTGSTNGFSSHLARYDDGTLIIVLRNVEGGTFAKAIACDLAAIAFGLAPSDQPSVQTSCRP